MSNITTRKPSVKLVHGQAITTSLKVADTFGKRHNDVLRTIRELECTPEFGARNFALTSYTSAQGKTYPMYTITRDGFAFLASGFTGKEAAQWKEKYIAAFNELERRALEKATAKRLPKPIPSKAEGTLPPAQKSLPAVTSEIQSRINKRAFELSHGAYEIYRRRMNNEPSVTSGRTHPDNWVPQECQTEVLEGIECAAGLMEAFTNTLRNRGRYLGGLVGVDFDAATQKFRKASA